MIKTSVIIPTYNPTDKLISVVHGLIEVGFSDIIIVNDGSLSENDEIFRKLQKYDFCTILHHETNKGKGRALKTGIKFFQENRTNKLGIVTADDDGQHSPEDIKNCALFMEESGNSVLGTRNFNNKAVPLKSRLGNKITSFIMKVFCGIKLSDTQTGLRAFPLEQLSALLETAGERYEYETNVLLEIKQRGFIFSEQPIKTIYFDYNKATHFNAFTDTIKIYSIIIKFLIGSLSCFVIDIVAFTLLNLGLSSLWTETDRILIATVAARAFSSAVNFVFNRNKVFKSQTRFLNSMIKYYALCIVQLLTSYGIVLLISSVTQTEQSFGQSVIKLATDMFLFFISFKIQQEWVFKKREKQ